MISLARKTVLVAGATLCAALGISVLRPSIALSNGGSITALGVPLTENFDTLSAAGTWTDNSTIPGWYSTRVAYVLGTGSSNTGALYSFGVAGTNPATDRALGSVASTSTGTVFHAAKLTNNTGSTISSLDISYVGEQWRNGGNTTGHTLTFQYQVANAGVVTGANSGSWTTFAPLSFTGPVATATAGALDGNAGANRTAKSATLTVSVAAGQEIWLRWQDLDDSGSDHGLAIDDFSVTASGVAGDPAPVVTGTAPSDLGTNVSISSTIGITFSESVNTTASAFSIQCPNGTPVSFTPSGSPATVFTLTPTANLPYGQTCTVTVNASQVTDEDAVDPADQMASNFVFSFTTVASPIDPAPAVATTSPSNNATGVAVGSNIIINFSESVLAGPSAFAINCGALQSFALIGSPGASLTLDPDADLPHATICTVAVTASQVTDVDGNDPDDQMATDFSFSFATADPPLPSASVVINEIDADTPGNDTAEFIELFDGGAGNTALDGLVVVLFAGPNASNPSEEQRSYAAFDLDGYTTDANGYFTLGNPGIPGVDLIFSPGSFGLLQNGADAVAVFTGNDIDFPVGTPVTTANLQDAIVYGTDDADDPQLLVLLNPGQEQVNESAAGSPTTQSNARCENGSGGARNTATYRQSIPTPDGENNACPPPPPAPGSSTIVISQLYGGGGNSGATYRNDFVELYNRGGAAVDITGWSLQYASSTGSGWDFNKQPLAGIISPGEYYLISLASGGANGAPLPTANVSGGLINMAAGSGKVALIDNFEALAGTCPKFSIHLKDLVGYGSANCREGSATAPAGPNNTTALLRKLGGATDTDQNGSDFATGPPSPRQTAPIVELGPYVLSTDPARDGTDAPRDATIQVTFTEPVDVVDPWITISCASSGLHDSFTQAGTGQSRFITPNVDFEAGEECTVTILKDQVHDQDSDDAAPGSDAMTANHSWSFVVATGTPAPFPLSVHLTMGNPTGAVADIGQPNNYLMEKPEFTLSYDRDLGRPNWVSWHLSSEWFGTLARVDTFRADPALPADWYRVQSFDFSGSGFDRGHMVPNADRDKETSTPINQATFLMTNMVAQAPDNNQGPWAQFEGYLRELAGTDNEIYLVAGGVGIGGTGSNGGISATIAGGHVAVPERTWKVALVLPNAIGDDIARVSCATRTIAVDMPNTQGIRNDPWENYLTSIDAIEALTGYDLFSRLPLAIQACVEAGINGNNPPLDATPPSISCASADGIWHASNVNLSCSASDTGSGLEQAGEASFTLVTSVVDDIEDSNASTDIRVICDVAGNCATAGPIGGNRIDRLAPTITMMRPSTGAVYQLNRSITASYSCVEGGAGLTSCAGSVANGAAIDTASAGAKTFTVNAGDAVGNTSISTVNYTVAANGISISNMPSSAFIGGSFVPAFAYAGNGATSVTTNTPARCTVSGGIVTFIDNGKCVLLAHAEATATFAAATGSPQAVVIGKQIATISITNIPVAAVNGGSFIPALVYGGDGATHVRSETLAICRVSPAGEVRFVAGGTCTLVARASGTGNFDPVVGAPQSFTVGAASTTISIKNVPNKPQAGKSFVPRFEYGGDGQTSVTSSTPATCSVSGEVVNFMAAGICALTAQATATASYTATTGAPESFLIR